MKVFLLAAVTLLTACASYRTLEKHPGLPVRYDADFPATVSAARDALVASGFRIDREQATGKDTITFYAKLGASLQSWGQVMKLQVAKRDTGSTVSILNAARISINVTEDLAGPSRNVTARIRTALETRKAKQNGIF